MVFTYCLSRLAIGNVLVLAYDSPMLDEAAPCYKIGNTWLSLAPVLSHHDGQSDTNFSITFFKRYFI